MLKSKAKDCVYEEPSKLYLWWIESTIGNWYYDFTWKFIENPIFQVTRLWQWYWNVFRFDYDFDGHCLYRIIEYKLKRLLVVLENGMAIQEDHDIKALKLAIKLAGRLKEDSYDIDNHDRHQKKWGVRASWRESYPNATTPEQKEQCKSEYLAGIHASIAKMEREEKWLFNILAKYLRVWWD